MSRKVLVIGSGGREHALIRQLAASPQEPVLFAAPGNPGTAEQATNVDLNPGNHDSVVDFCRRQEIDLVIIGPEDPLIDGLADSLHKAEISVFGPGAMGARLEGDKEFCKEVLASAGVPTAHYHAFSSSNAALKHLDTSDLPIVIKACGAAQGKGVAVCSNKDEAERFIRECLDDQRFGGAGLRIIMEDCLFGPELSVLIVTDGQDYCMLAPSRDHKRIGENDTGPNTGGMGAFAPVDLADELYSEIDARIVLPVLAELRRRDIPYRGVLYAGLMLTENGPMVLEFNARFGDPECQALMMQLDSSLLDLLDAATDRRLDAITAPRWREGASIAVVMAAEGYPGRVKTGQPIRGLEAAAAIEGVEVFQAATRLEDGRSVTAGGRVLAVTASDTSLARAKLRAYTAVKAIRWPGGWCRKDIADKGLRRERELVAAEADAAGADG
jgi:phosphoribosylamine--glycine ligase